MHVDPMMCNATTQSANGSAWPGFGGLLPRVVWQGGEKGAPRNEGWDERSRGVAEITTSGLGLRGRVSAAMGPPPAARSGQIAEAHVPLILYSPVSWLLLPPLLRMLNAGEALDPTVSTLSNPGCAASVVVASEAAEPGRWCSSCWRAAGRRANGLRIGMVVQLNIGRLSVVLNGFSMDNGTVEG